MDIIRAITRKTIRLFKDSDKTLLTLSIIFFIIGLFNIVSASGRVAVVRYDKPLFYFFILQLLMLLAGLFASVVIVNVNTKNYKGIVSTLYFILLAILVYLLFAGNTVSGSKNWIEIPFIGIPFQPSEFTKPVIIVFLSILFERYNVRLNNKNVKHISMIGTILFVGLAIPAIVFLQKDLGTAMIIVGIFAMMFFASPIINKEKLQIVGIVLLATILASIVIIGVRGEILTSEQLERITGFIDPCSNYERGGYQICNGYIAINNGGLLGLGIGRSQQKYSYIPEPHTDSVFAIFAEEMGFVISTIIFILYAWILIRILRISKMATTIRGRYMALGIATYIFLHITVNLGGLFGVMPLTGVPLPFLSYGGSFAISLASSLTIVQRVQIETNREKMRTLRA